MAELVRSPIDVGKLITEASRPDCGAVSLFIGNSRDHAIALRGRMRDDEKFNITKRFVHHLVRHAWRDLDAFEELVAG